MKNFTARRCLLIAFYMGFAAIISQTLLLREILTLCRGNELLIGIIFFSWFLGIYVGARINTPAERSLYGRVISSMFLLPVLLAASVYVLNLTPVLLTRQTGTFYSFSTEFFLCLFFTLPVGFVVGLFFPALVSLSSSYARNAGGMVYYAESLGSFTGGIAFSFVLVELANPLACASILMIAAIVIAFSRHRHALLLFSVIPLLLAIFSGAIERNIFAYAWNKTHTGELIDYRRTKYGMISVEKSTDAVAVYGDGMLMYTLPDRYESRGILHLVRAFGRDNKRVLLFGSGPGSLLHNLLGLNIEVSYFDTDPDIWDILLPYVRNYYEDTHQNKLTLPGDLRAFLKDAEGKEFDMIISLPPPPGNIMLNRFYTREFYSLCKRRLSGNGIFISALHGFGEYMSDDTRNYIASIYSAFVKEFPEHVVASGETIYLFGAKKTGILPQDFDELIPRYAGSSPADTRLEKEISDNYSPDELRMFFEKTRIKYFNSIIPDLAGRSSANSDIKPAAYWKYIVFTAFREDSAMYSIIRGFIFFPLIMIILSIIALLDVQRNHGLRSMLNSMLMYIIGFVGISVMMTLILIFQNSHGIVYYRVALINAFFMLGLASGSYVFSKHTVKLFYIFSGIITSLLMVLLLTLFDLQIFYWISIIIFSFFCGSVFPLLFNSAGLDYYSAASLLDSMDHFGAIAGSFLTVAAIVPLAGITGTIILNIVLVLAACGVSFFLTKIDLPS